MRAVVRFVTCFFASAVLRAVWIWPTESTRPHKLYVYMEKEFRCVCPGPHRPLAFTLQGQRKSEAFHRNMLKESGEQGASRQGTADGHQELRG